MQFTRGPKRRPFCFQNATYADILFTNGADYLLHLQADVLDATPKLKALYKRVISSPNVAKYIAKRPNLGMSLYIKW